MSEGPQHKLIAVTVHTPAAARRFAIDVDGVKGINISTTPTGAKHVLLVLEDGRYIGFYGFPVEQETEPQLIATADSVKLT